VQYTISFVSGADSMRAIASIPSPVAVHIGQSSVCSHVQRSISALSSSREPKTLTVAQCPVSSSNCVVNCPINARAAAPKSALCQLRTRGRCS
jgi:hypothetical protein